MGQGIPFVDREREIEELDKYLNLCKSNEEALNRKQFPSVVIGTTPGMGKVH